MTDQEPDRVPEQEPVGSLAEEAGRLLAALGDWARDQGPDLGAGVAGQAAAAAGQVEDHLATGSAACTYCPICRAVHVVRSANPEVRAQLSVAASALLQAGAGLLAALGAHPERAGQTRRGGPPVERIDLDEDDQHPGSGAENDDGWEA